MRVIDGMHRLAAARHRGDRHVDVVFCPVRNPSRRSVAGHA
jgi:hypothetical protein